MERGKYSPRRDQNARVIKTGPRNSEQADAPARRNGGTGTPPGAPATLPTTVMAKTACGTAEMNKATAERITAKES